MSDPKRAKTVHLNQGVGVACGAHEGWRSRHRAYLDLPRTREPEAVTCHRCKRTWAFSTQEGKPRG